MRGGVGAVRARTPDHEAEEAPPARQGAQVEARLEVPRHHCAKAVRYRSCSELHTPEFPFTVAMDRIAAQTRSRTTWYAPLVARRDLGDARPYWLRRAGARPDDRAPARTDLPSILLIDSVERRIRRLGYDPIRTFDAERRWRLEAAGVVIAEGRSLDELSRAAHAWLEARRGPE